MDFKAMAQGELTNHLSGPLTAAAIKGTSYIFLDVDEEAT